MKKIVEFFSKLYSKLNSFEKNPNSAAKQALLEEELAQSFYQVNIIFLILWILGAYGLIYNHISAILITLLVGSLTIIYIFSNKKKDLKDRVIKSIGKIVDNIKVILSIVISVLIIIYGFSFYNTIVNKNGDTYSAYSDAKIIFNVFTFYGGAIFGTMLLVFMIAKFIKYDNE